ncbi:MAG: 3-dehydroquinate synthase family protein [Candidatus Wallbacteria bacterium]
MTQNKRHNILFTDSEPFEFIKAQLSLLSDTGRLFVVSTGKILEITGLSETLKELEKSGKCFIHILKTDGEKCKSFSNVNLVLKKLTDMGFGKNDILIGIGGGTITDLSGFSASIYKRGMRLAFIPTTLLCMIDASIGGKNAVNISRTKNAAGTFYNPEKIFIIPDLLKSLPANEMANGMFEALKYGLLFSKSLVTAINQKNFNFTNYNLKSKSELIRIIKQCVQFKQEIVNADYLDKGCRMLLNAGHTFGHAIESVSNNKISHGAAVGLGLYFETTIGRELGIIQDKHNISEIISNLISFFEKSGNAGLIQKWQNLIKTSKLEKYIINDKKAGTSISAAKNTAVHSTAENHVKIKIPFITKIGRAEIIEIDFNNELLPFLKNIKAVF